MHCLREHSDWIHLFMYTFIHEAYHTRIHVHLRISIQHTDTYTSPSPIPPPPHHSKSLIRPLRNEKHIVIPLTKHFIALFNSPKSQASYLFHSVVNKLRYI